MNAPHHAPFFRVPHTRHKTSGGEVELPIAYHDNSHLVALFNVASEPVRAALRPEGLAPVLTRGQAQVGLVFFEYAASAVGRYNEVGLSSLAVIEGETLPGSPLLEILRAPRTRRVGMFVHDLPVTTEIARSAGRELWGYPKFVTEIPITWGKRDFRGEVKDPQDGSTIVELRGERGFGIPIPAIQILTYSRLDGRLLRTPVDVRGRSFAARGGTLRVRVGPSQHPMAQHLRAFGLDGATPDLVVDARHAWSLLYPGEPVTASYKL